MILRVHGMAFLLCLTAGVALADRPAKGLPAPAKTSFGTQLQQTWPEGRQPKLVEDSSGEWTPEFQANNVAAHLTGEPAEAELESGIAEFARFEFPNGELSVRRVTFANAAAAQAGAGHGVSLDEPSLAEVRGSKLLLIQGSTLGQASAKGIAKLRSSAWSTNAGLAPAANWTSVSLVAGDGDYVLLHRGAGVFDAPFSNARDTAREKQLNVVAGWFHEWLDSGRYTFALVMGDKGHIELNATDTQGSFVTGANWARVEGLKAFARQVLNRRLPSAPEGMEPREWANAHRRARLTGSSTPKTPVLLTALTRTPEPQADPSPEQGGPEQGGPAQTGLTEGVDQKAKPKD